MQKSLKYMHIKIQEMCKILPDISATTIEAVLGTMVKNGVIKIIGSGRNTKYIKL